MFARLFGRRAAPTEAQTLFARIVEQARSPDFYTHCGVPDSFDGRFEMVALHAFLVLHRLKGAEGASAKAVAQDLVDILFADIDRTFRELGAADIGVGRRVQKVAEAVYGRIAAYDQALAAPEPALAEAIQRNVYGTVAEAQRPGHDGPATMADYVRRCVVGLAAAPDSALIAGTIRFAAPPGRQD
ncbi:MAG: hypothetical protein JNL66_07175 [Alphaproteobacteria bacterium]|nr:hypothetical protein [Alphaproteobacteria bacterium]